MVPNQSTHTDFGRNSIDKAKQITNSIFVIRPNPFELTHHLHFKECTSSPTNFSKLRILSLPRNFRTMVLYGSKYKLQLNRK